MKINNKRVITIIHESMLCKYQTHLIFKENSFYRKK